MDCTKNGMPLFDGHNYAFWSKRMSVFLREWGFDVWKAIVNGYKSPSCPPIDRDEKKLYENHSKAMNVI
jgi:hypothetical protein